MYLHLPACPASVPRLTPLYPPCTMLPLLLLSLLSLSPPCDTEVVSDEFTKTSICNTQILRSSACLTDFSVPSLTKIKCAAQCAQMTSCSGFLWTVTSCALQNTSCDVDSTCSDDSSGEEFYLRYIDSPVCQNDGTLDTETNQCVCVGGYVGVSCERLAVSCGELREQGYPIASLKAFTLHPEGFDAPKEFLCAQSVTEIRTFFAINTGNGGFFNRTWDDYVNGFGVTDGNNDYWMGLAAMHYFVSSRSIPKIRMTVTVSGGGVTYNYVDLEVLGADQNYAAYALLSIMNPQKDRAQEAVTGAVNKTDGCFLNQKYDHTEFSTPERDNDMTDDYACANQSRTGWWFSGCTPNPDCNPLGMNYASGNETVQPYHIHFPFVNMQMLHDVFVRVRMFLVENA